MMMMMMVKKNIIKWMDHDALYQTQIYLESCLEKICHLNMEVNIFKCKAFFFKIM